MSDYFCLGTTLANMVNLSTILSEAPSVLTANDGLPMPLLGGVEKIVNGVRYNDGFANGRLAWDYLYPEDLNALTLALTGSLTTRSRRMYVVTLDETGQWSPFRCVVSRPYPGSGLSFGVNLTPRGVRVDLIDGILQSATKSSDTTLVASERLVYGNTAGGNVTLTLVAASSVQANTPVRLVKSSASNTLTYQRGGSDTLNGGTSGLTLTALNSTVTLVSDGVSAWRTI